MTRIPRTTVVLGLLVLVAQTGCGSDGTDDASPGENEAAASSAQPASPPATDAAEAPAREIVGAIVRFSSRAGAVDVTIGEDSPAVRDFLSTLPLTLTLEEHAGREKIAYLPRELRHSSSSGSDPENGDLIYFVPWGNLGFYYNADGIGYSDDTLHIGTYDATRAELERLEGEVTVDRVG